MEGEEVDRLPRRGKGVSAALLRLVVSQSEEGEEEGKGVRQAVVAAARRRRVRRRRRKPLLPLRRILGGVAGFVPVRPVVSSCGCCG